VTRHQGEWHLVGRDSDPVPADRFDVDDAAADFAARGAVMDEAAATLKAFSDLEEWTGEAAVKFADKASEAHSDLNKAGEKYTDAGAALAAFADRINEARLDTWKALQAAVEADEAKRANAHSLLDGVNDPSDELQDADRRRSDDHDAAISALTKARQDLDAAMDVLDAEASNCAARINQASEKFKDSRMDNIKGFVAAAVDVLNVIAIVILAIVVIVVLIAVLGPFGIAALLATAGRSMLMTASAVVGVAILALTSIQFAMGEADGMDLLLATAGAVAGPLGKWGGRLAAPALARMSTAARTTAAASARASVGFRLNASTSSLLSRVPILGSRFPLANTSRGLDAANDLRVTSAVARVDTALATATSPTAARAIAEALDINSFAETIRVIHAVSRTGDQSLLAGVNAVRGGLSVQGIGFSAGSAALVDNVINSFEPITNTIDNIVHPLDATDLSVTDRPTQIVDVGR
jgi:uncharacterized protein YukE